MERERENRTAEQRVRFGSVDYKITFAWCSDDLYIDRVLTVTVQSNFALIELNFFALGNDSIDSGIIAES